MTRLNECTNWCLSLQVMIVLHPPCLVQWICLNLSYFKLWRPSHRHYKHWRSHPSEKVLLPSTFKLHNQKTIGAMLNNLLRSEHVRGREIRLQIDTCRKEMEGLSSWSCIFARTARSKNIDEYRTLRNFDLLKLSYFTSPHHWRQLKSQIMVQSCQRFGGELPGVEMHQTWRPSKLLYERTAKGSCNIPWAKTRADSWDKQQKHGKTRPKRTQIVGNDPFKWIQIKCSLQASRLIHASCNDKSWVKKSTSCKCIFSQPSASDRSHILCLPKEAHANAARQAVEFTMRQPSAHTTSISSMISTVAKHIERSSSNISPLRPIFTCLLKLRCRLIP